MKCSIYLSNFTGDPRKLINKTSKIVRAGDRGIMGAMPTCIHPANNNTIALLQPGPQ